MFRPKWRWVILASVEPTFDANEDTWFDLDLEQKHVILRKRPYIRRGEVGNWLVSDAFDLKEPRSLRSSFGGRGRFGVSKRAMPEAAHDRHDPRKDRPWG